MNFTFQIISTNVADNTVVVGYTPNDARLTSHLVQLGLPRSVIPLSNEEILNYIKKVAPITGWRRELESIENPVDLSGLDSLIGVDQAATDETGDFIPDNPVIDNVSMPNTTTAVISKVTP